MTSIVLYYELRWIFDPFGETKDVENFKKLSQENKGKRWNDFSEDYKSEIKNKSFRFIILFWLFLGLLTFQWDAFLLIIIFNIFVVHPLSTLVRYNQVYTALHWLNSIVGFAFGIFVILNNYHLHISLIQLIRQYFKI